MTFENLMYGKRHICVGYATKNLPAEESYSPYITKLS
jgi:hypothetical protein